jgi:hypothetical protein
VLHEREPQRLARQGLLHLQVAQLRGDVVGRTILFLMRLRSSLSSIAKGTQRSTFS